MTPQIQFLTQPSQLFDLDKRLAPCNDDVPAPILRDCLDRCSDRYVFVLRRPTRIRGVAPNTPQVAIAGPEKYGRHADVFSLALNSVEEFTEFHVEPKHALHG